MNNVIELAHRHPQPLDFSEIERRDRARNDYAGIERRTPKPDRGSRQPALESVRYLMITLQDILEALQTDWPIDRPQSQKLRERLGFAEFALARLRRGELRRMAEEGRAEAQTKLRDELGIGL